MIICTKNADTLARRAFESNEVAVGDFNAMLQQLPVDPTISSPRRDAYIFTSDDIRNPKVRQAFLSAVQNKHSKAIVILIAKQSKSPITIESCPQLNEVLVRPKPAQLKAVVAQQVSINADKTIVHSAGEDIPQIDENPVPNLGAFDEAEEQEEVKIVFEEQLPIEEPQPEIQPEPEPKPDRESELVRRISQAGCVGDAAVLARELTASAVIKDMMESSQSYAAAEEKLKAIQNNIYSIMCSSEIPTLEEKLDKVRALLHDKNYYRSKNDTLIEQRVEEVIDTLLETTKSLVEERLNEIDTAIVNNRVNDRVEKDFGRLAGITEERANLIMELAVLSREVIDIAKASDSFIVDSIGYIAQCATDLTGNELLNARLRLENEQILSDETLIAIKSGLEVSADRLPSEYKQLQLKVQVLLNKLNKLFDLDKETIAAQRAYINFLKANKIEDTVVARSLIKKSLSVFVGPEGVGRTIIPYLLSYYKSRQNANVLLVDLTGTCKASDYGIRPINLEDYLNNRYEKEFCYVSGEIVDSASAAQRLLTSLTKAADFYRVINVVMSPEQQSLFDVIAPDVLCVNYIVDPSLPVLRQSAKLIKETRKPNTAQRVIINKCDVPCTSIIHKLELDNVMDIGLCKIPTCSALIDASLGGYNPVQMSSVTLAIDEVLRNVRS